MNIQSAPLKGIKVLDLSRVLAGPWCTQILADLGAEVIKIESPEGDETRQWGPPFKGGISGYFACINRNKKSVVLNLKTQKDQEILHKLATQADIVVENFRTGVAARLGADYATLSKHNPKLVYGSISGYGRTGSRAEEPGYDFVIQAEGGIMSITGPKKGKPYKVGMAIVDITTGQNLAVGLMAALLHAQRTGQGQEVRVSLYDTQLQWLGNVASGVLFSGEDAKRYGNGHPSIVPYQAFKAADEAFALAVGNNRQWARLCDIMGQPDWETDKRFATNPARVQNRSTLIPLMDGIFTQKPAAYWLEKMKAENLPCSKIHTVQEALTSATAQERALVFHMPLSDAQTGEEVQIPLVQSPLRFTQTPVTYHSPPPKLGEHTAEILKNIDKSYK